MRRLVLVLVALALIAGTMVGGATGFAAPAGSPSAADSMPTVLVVPVQGTVNPGLAQFVLRGLREARSQGAAAVLLEVETLGGLVDSALEMRDAILASPVPVIGLVRGRAWSAGALITIACGKVAMSPGSSIGSAEPRPADAKTISAIRAEFEATAEARGRDKQVAAAMVDQQVVIQGVKEKGQILNLTAVRAKELGVADIVADTRENALASFGLAGANLVVLERTLGDAFGRFITDPVVTAILVIAGALGLLVEAINPGFGVPGIVGLLSLITLLLGRTAAQVAGAESMLLFVAGLVLLSIEAFIPGFGVIGLAGIGLSVAGIVMAARAATSTTSVLISVVLALLCVAAAYRYAAKKGVWSRLTIHETSGTQTLVPVLSLGQAGVTTTSLRPSGMVDFEGKRASVVTSGEFIEAGTAVTVISVTGNRIVVAALTDTDANRGGAR